MSRRTLAPARQYKFPYSAKAYPLNVVDILFTGVRTKPLQEAVKVFQAIRTFSKKGCEGGWSVLPTPNTLLHTK